MELILSQDQLMSIGKMLEEIPYKHSASIINLLNKYILDQAKNESDKTKVEDKQ